MRIFRACSGSSSSNTARSATSSSLMARSRYPRVSSRCRDRRPDDAALCQDFRALPLRRPRAGRSARAALAARSHERAARPAAARKVCARLRFAEFGAHGFLLPLVPARCGMVRHRAGLRPAPSRRKTRRRSARSTAWQASCATRASRWRPHHDADVGWMAEDVSTILADVARRTSCWCRDRRRHPQKRWPHYAELAQALMAAGYDVVTAPGPDETGPDLPGHALRGDEGFSRLVSAGGRDEGCGLRDRQRYGADASRLASGRARAGAVWRTCRRKRTGVLRERFAAIEVEDLKALSVARVMEEAVKRLS